MLGFWEKHKGNLNYNLGETTRKEARKIIKNIHKSYGTVKVLKGVNFSVEKGEIVAVVGQSGVGKSTLLQILGTLDKPDKKNYFKLDVNGVSLQDLNEKEIAFFRNQHIGFIFQFHQLLPEFTALENICIPAYIGKKSAKESEQNHCDYLIFHRQADGSPFSSAW